MEVKSKIKLGYKSQQWFDDHNLLVLDEGQTVYLAEPDTNNPTAPKSKRGDGINALEDLIFSTSGGGSGTVQSVTGPSVDITDPANPIVNAPTDTEFAELVQDVDDLENNVADLEIELEDHINAPVDAHASAAISTPAVGELIGLTVKDQLAEIAAIIANVLDVRGFFSMAPGLFPASGGSGPAGVILSGDYWDISVGGTDPGGTTYIQTDGIYALVDNPGVNPANWAKKGSILGYVPMSIAEFQSGAAIYAVTSGTNAYTANMTPPITAWITGMKFHIDIGSNTNTITNPTFNPNGIGAKTIVKLGNIALEPGELWGVIEVIYNGTNLEITSARPCYLTYSGTTGAVGNPLDATTVYLGTRSISIALGVSANADPIFVRYAGVIVAAGLSFTQTAGDATTWTSNLRHNDTTNYVISAATINNATNTHFENFALNVSVVRLDRLQFQLVFPTWPTTNPTNVTAGWFIIQRLFR